MNKRVVENSEYAAFAVRAVKGLAKRAAGDVDTLPQLAEIGRLVEQLTADAIANCRAEGYSWTDVGDRLGVSRQAAQQRYGKVVA